MSQNKKSYEIKWNNINLCMTQEEYDMAMTHVEHMRHMADEDNAYGRHKEGDEDHIGPCGWKLSDTLGEALEEGEMQPCPDKMEAIRQGLKILNEGIDFTETCTDEDADDIF